MAGVAKRIDTRLLIHFCFRDAGTELTDYMSEVSNERLVLAWLIN